MLSRLFLTNKKTSRLTRIKGKQNRPFICPWLEQPGKQRKPFAVSPTNDNSPSTAFILHGKTSRGFTLFSTISVQLLWTFSFYSQIQTKSTLIRQKFHSMLICIMRKFFQKGQNKKFLFTLNKKLIKQQTVLKFYPISAVGYSAL